MTRPSILDPTGNYTFSEYRELVFDIVDILAEFDTTLRTDQLPIHPLAKGFVQLAVELIALDLWTDSQAPVLYGAVTTGDVWKFGLFHRQKRYVQQEYLRCPQRFRHSSCHPLRND